jgi:radical SAM protein with 4Fe4S-binding SPASM domain
MRKRLSHLFDLFKIYIKYCVRSINCNYFPIRVWIELSSRCNLKCLFCMNSILSPSEKGDMDLDLYKKIIDEISGKVCDINLFHRGEPLMNKSVTSMIDYAAKKAIRTRIHTNATILGEKLSREIILAGLDFISFSFDGFTKDSYEKNRSGAIFEKTLSNIIGFLKIKKQLRSDKPYTVIQVIQRPGESLSNKTARDKERFLKNFKDLPLDRLVVRAPHNWGGLLKVERSSASRAKNTRVIPCTFPWYSLTVFYDGRVFLCPQDFRGRICLGDLNESSIEEIFDGVKIQEIRRRFKKGMTSDLNPCRECDRIRRKTFLKIPGEYLGDFLRNNLRD